MAVPKNVTIGILYGFLSTLSLGPNFLFSLRTFLFIGIPEGKVFVSGSFAGQFLIYLSIYYAPLYQTLIKPHLMSLVVLPYLVSRFFLYTKKREIQTVFCSLQKNCTFFIDGCLIQLLNPVIFGNSTLTRLINVFLFRYSSNFVFVLCVFCGYVGSNLLLLHFIKLLFIRLNKSTYTNYQIKRFCGLIFFCYIYCFLGSVRIPCSIYPWRTNFSWVKNDNEQTDQSLVWDLEKGTSLEKKKEDSLVQKNTFSKWKKLWPLEWPVLFFNYQRWIRNTYIKPGVSFLPFLKDRVSQYFFGHCYSDGKEKLCFTLLPTKFTLAKNLEDLKKIYSHNDKIWTNNLKNRKNVLWKEFRNRVNRINKAETLAREENQKRYTVTVKPIGVYDWALTFQPTMIKFVLQRVYQLIKEKTILWPKKRKMWIQERAGSRKKEALEKKIQLTLSRGETFQEFEDPLLCRSSRLLMKYYKLVEKLSMTRWKAFGKVYNEERKKRKEERAIEILWNKLEKRLKKKELQEKEYKNVYEIQKGRDSITFEMFPEEEEITPEERLLLAMGRIKEKLDFYDTVKTRFILRFEKTEQDLIEQIIVEEQQKKEQMIKTRTFFDLLDFSDYQKRKNLQNSYVYYIKKSKNIVFHSYFYGIKNICSSSLEKENEYIKLIFMDSKKENEKMPWNYFSFDHVRSIFPNIESFSQWKYFNCKDPFFENKKKEKNIVIKTISQINRNKVYTYFLFKLLYKQINDKNFPYKNIINLFLVLKDKNRHLVFIYFEKLESKIIEEEKLKETNKSKDIELNSIQNKEMNLSTPSFQKIEENEVRKELPQWESDLIQDFLYEEQTNKSDFRAAPLKNVGYYEDEYGDDTELFVRAKHASCNNRLYMFKGSIRSRKGRSIKPFRLNFRSLKKQIHSPVVCRMKNKSYINRKIDFQIILVSILNFRIRSLCKMVVQVFLKINNKFIQRLNPSAMDKQSKIVKNLRISVYKKKYYANLAKLDHHVFHRIRGPLLIAQAFLRRKLVLPLLIGIKNIGRILLLQVPEFQEDWEELSQEIYINCTFDGIEFSEESRPGKWWEDGFQIKILNPFRLKPWHKPLDTSHRVKPTYMSIGGYEVYTPYGNKVRTLGFWQPLLVEIKKKLSELSVDFSLTFPFFKEENFFSNIKRVQDQIKGIYWKETNIHSQKRLNQIWSKNKNECFSEKNIQKSSHLDHDTWIIQIKNSLNCLKEDIQKKNHESYAIQNEIDNLRRKIINKNKQLEQSSLTGNSKKNNISKNGPLIKNWFFFLQKFDQIFDIYRDVFFYFLKNLIYLSRIYFTRPLIIIFKRIFFFNRKQVVNLFCLTHDKRLSQAYVFHDIWRCVTNDKSILTQFFETKTSSYPFIKKNIKKYLLDPKSGYKEPQQYKKKNWKHWINCYDRYDLNSEFLWSYIEPNLWRSKVSQQWKIKKKNFKEDQIEKNALMLTSYKKKILFKLNKRYRLNLLAYDYLDFNKKEISRFFLEKKRIGLYSPKESFSDSILNYKMGFQDTEEFFNELSNKINNELFTHFEGILKFHFISETKTEQEKREFEIFFIRYWIFCRRKRCRFWEVCNNMPSIQLLSKKKKLLSTQERVYFEFIKLQKRAFFIQKWRQEQAKKKKLIQKKRLLKKAEKDGIDVKKKKESIHKELEILAAQQKRLTKQEKKRKLLKKRFGYKCAEISTIRQNWIESKAEQELLDKIIDKKIEKRKYLASYFCSKKKKQAKEPKKNEKKKEIKEETTLNISNTLEKQAILEEILIEKRKKITNNEYRHREQHLQKLLDLIDDQKDDDFINEERDDDMYRLFAKTLHKEILYWKSMKISYTNLIKQFSILRKMANDPKRIKVFVNIYFQDMPIEFFLFTHDMKKLDFRNKDIKNIILKRVIKPVSQLPMEKVLRRRLINISFLFPKENLEKQVTESFLKLNNFFLEDIFLPKRRREFRILNRLNCKKPKKKNVEDNFYFHQNFNQKITKNIYLESKIKMKQTLWPSYRLEDLLCMNRYWFNTADGSRNSIWRIRMFCLF
uniref:Protein TIC 214 n=1 Tax=Ephedra sinica TaxID=33152 RepID=A0A5C0F3W2_EPHSI|nr:hypothetical chloroplast RF19 [Ephedra sinica]QEI59949.1 hypothetical chloroplast RF19 [Ephedra sinica]QJQ26610.1 hypothetical protein [Ephedra sinica]QXG18267.1 hypothetical protein [Ephedra sinica]